MKITECLMFILMVVGILMLLIPASLRSVRGGNDDVYIYGLTRGKGTIPLPFGVDDTVGHLIKEYKKWYQRDVGQPLNRRVMIRYGGEPINPQTLLSDAGIGPEAEVEIIILPPQWSPNNDIGLRIVIKALAQNHWVIDDSTMELLLRHDLNPSTGDDGKLYNIEDWDVSHITDMNEMFYEAETFNEDISLWDTSNVTSMKRMFQGANSFNQDIGGWDTSKVTDMKFMFEGARAFNQPLNWKTSNVEYMSYMFAWADSFNADISMWDTSKVRYLDSMFHKAISFNQDISGWNTSNVVNMAGMFFGAKVFNQDIGNWNTSNVTNMSHMFRNARAFDQDISNWDVSRMPRYEGPITSPYSKHEGIFKECEIRQDYKPPSFR